MKQLFPDERRFECPACGCSDMIAWTAWRQPQLPFVYTCPKCKKEHRIELDMGPPPVQPTDPAAKATEGAVLTRAA